MWTNTIETLKPNDPKLFKINRSLIEKKLAIHPLRGPKGLVFDPSTKAELFASELETQFTCPTGLGSLDSEVLNTITILDRPHPREISPISPTEVWEIIKHLPKRKSPGPDQITNAALRKISKRTLLHLTKIYNSCFRFEHFPAFWKKANVVMIPKPGKNNLIPTNHRPILLLNSIAKIFEILLLIRLKKVTASIIRPEQYAFRKGHSTSIQLTALVDELVISANRKERTAAVFLDFEKAFDKVWHLGLLAKLISYNIPLQLINLIRSFLENRSFCVRCENSLSKLHHILAGVLQGSCLSPILFNLYINDIPSTPRTKINLFADDTMYFSNSVSKHHAANLL